MRRSKPGETAARALLESARDAARAPALFGEGRVPDTLDGRFECMALHVALIQVRLGAQDASGEPAAGATAQMLLDVFFEDLDAALRELGAGDLSMGKKMRRMGEAFYGRMRAYRDALDEPAEAALEAALTRNLLAEANASDGFLTAVAGYVRMCHAQLAEQALEALLAGEPVRWGRLAG